MRAAVSARDWKHDGLSSSTLLDDLHSTWVGVKTGQWIIRGVKGEFYPCDDEVLRATYEQVPDGR